ncbi:MAG: FG-GAP-like repeat-containing protein [Acidimicrobiia bacterium]
MTAILVVWATAALGVVSPAVARSAPTEPDGTTTLLDDGAWSWFENERAILSHDGTLLAVSAVVGESSAVPPPGTVALVELDLASGKRRFVDLGRTEADDHNSAAIWETPGGEILTSWARHNKDTFIHTHRRRTDGSWLAIPRIDTGSPATYSNLFEATVPEDPATSLYDFYRGERWDPSILRSDDLGRTWTNLGRLLRDPDDDVFGRPYVNYTSDGAGRIDLIATEQHPGNDTTSIYHGFISGGRLHDSAGNDLGAVGSAVPVTALTPVWSAVGNQRAWTADVALDPVTGNPVAAFSVRHTPEDHRYWHARWNGTSWSAHEIAYAGSALYEPEIDYTGLVSLDPEEPDLAVISTDVDPATGTPLVSGTDGLRHHELFAGRVGNDGAVAWLPLTADSTADNIRPVLTAHASGAHATLWLRGRYTTFRDYDLSVVGVVRRPDGTAVAAGPATTVPVVHTVPVGEPHGSPAMLAAGAFDGHRATDLLMARTGSGPELLVLGDEQRHPTAVDPPSVNGTYTPLVGDFDGDGLDDIFWYVPGTAPDSVWSGAGAGTFTHHGPHSVNGWYRPVAGDFDGDGLDDIFWYAPGTAPEYMWRGTTGGGFVDESVRSINGTYTPVVGDYDADGFDDILWYAPGSGRETLWSGAPGPAFAVTSTHQVLGFYTPVAGDFDGDGAGDIHWYAPGRAVDYLWWSASGPLAQTALYTNL